MLGTSDTSFDNLWAGKRALAEGCSKRAAEEVRDFSAQIAINEISFVTKSADGTLIFFSGRCEAHGYRASCQRHHRDL